MCIRDRFSNPQSEMLRGLVRHSQNFALPSGAFEQNGSIIKLTYAGENATEPVLFDAGKLFDVRLSILHGKICLLYTSLSPRQARG